jgi:hypothetical protein
VVQGRKEFSCERFGFFGIEFGIFPGFFHDLHLLGDVIRGTSSSGCPFLAGEVSPWRESLAAGGISRLMSGTGGGIIESRAE